MTPLPKLIDASGKPFPLERQLASGGEGAIFTLPNDKSQVAKVYHKLLTSDEIEKLTVIVGLVNPKLLGVAAWPNGLLLNARSRQVAGFVMPRLNDFHPIQELYNPVMRLKTFPRAGWTFQVRAALNLAAAFDEVHKAGYLVGDVNQSNAQVSPQALVRLIDCDSFQVRANGKQFLCKVGVPHYTPPELQGKSFRGVVRTENHDRFGLAVLIYQLLFVGRHPYMGLYRGAGDPSFEQLIAEFRFAQGPASRTWGMDPPPHTPIFTDIPPEVGTLFRRSFERGSEAGTRPRPAEWLTSLKQLEKVIVECVDDPGHMYWRGANSCVWCRLAEHSGPEYYFGVAGKTVTFSADEAKLHKVLRRLSASQLNEFQFDVNRFSPKSRPIANRLPKHLHEQRSIETVLRVFTGLCLFTIPFGLWHGFISIIGALGAIVFGGGLAIFRSQSSWHQEYRRRRIAHKHALDVLKNLETSWEQTVQLFRRGHSVLSDRINNGVTEYRGLTSEYSIETERLTICAEDLGRLRYLRLHLIADANIPKIGDRRTQTLAANRIITAADIDEHIIRKIDGFDDVLTNNLLHWKKEVLRQFRFNSTFPVSPSEQRLIQARFRTRQRQIMFALDQQLSKLESLPLTCHAELQKLFPKLTTAVADYEQTKADLELMTLKN